MMDQFIEEEYKKYAILGLEYNEFSTDAKLILKKEFAFLEDSEIITKYHANYKLPNSKVGDYKNKIIELDQTGSFLTSLRFKNLDINTPFIDILFSTFTIDGNNIVEIANKIKEVYPSIKYKFLRFFSNKEMPAIDSITKHKILFAKKIKNTTCELKDSGISIEVCNDSSIYKKYCNEYQAFHIKDIDNKKMAWAESEKNFKELVDEEKMYHIIFDGKIVGLIAYDFIATNLLKGISIVEELVFDKYRNRGFAKYAQCLLTSFLGNNHMGNLIMGTIHYRNIPSIKTALQNHRIEAGAWYTYN